MNMATINKSAKKKVISKGNKPARPKKKDNCVNVNKLTWYERLKSPSPTFFKRIKQVGIVLTSVSIMLLAANTNFNLGLPESVNQLGRYLGYGGFIAAAIASFTVDPEKLQDKIDKSASLSRGETTSGE